MQSRGGSRVQTHFSLDRYFVNFLHSVHWRRQSGCSRSRGGQAAAAAATATQNCSWSGLGNGQCEWNAANGDLLTALSVKKQWISVSEHRWNKQVSVSSGVEVRPGAGWAIYSRNSRILFYFWGMNSNVWVKSQPRWRSWRADLWRGRHSRGQKKWKWKWMSVQWDS